MPCQGSHEITFSIVLFIAEYFSTLGWCASAAISNISVDILNISERYRHLYVPMVTSVARGRQEEGQSRAALLLGHYFWVCCEQYVYFYGVQIGKQKGLPGLYTI